LSSVLIVGPRGDPQADRVARAIRARGGRAVRLDSHAFPERTRISFRAGVLSVGGRRLEQPDSVYIRSLVCDPLHPEFHEALTTRPHGLLAQTDEKYALLTSVLLTLERRGARLVNGLEANAQHGRKPYQLELLRTCGLPVPRFLASNDPRAVRGFVQTVRKAFVGNGFAKKAEVMRRVEMLGWTVDNHNESDAAALWWCQHHWLRQRHLTGQTDLVMARQHAGRRAGR